MMQSSRYLSDSFNLSNVTTTVGNGSSCPSSPVEWCTDTYDGFQFCIRNPTLLPTCILALIIGLSCSKRIAQLPGQFASRWFYQITFFLFGIMMTSAGILHCLLGDRQELAASNNCINGTLWQFLQLLFTIIDVGLTSNVAVSFLFCGLCDIRFLNPQSPSTRYLLFTSYFAVFVLWTLGILNQWKWTFFVLYFGVVAVGCSIFLLTQLCIKSNRSALPSLVVGGLYGAIGLFATSFGAEHVCQSEGPFWSQYIGPEFIWFLFSDISMAFVFIYVVRANQNKQVISGQYPIDIEDFPEKF